MNCKGCGRKRSWPNLRSISAFAWRDWGKLQRNQSGQLISRLRFESRTSRIWSRSVNHSTTTFSTSFNEDRDDLNNDEQRGWPNFLSQIKMSKEWTNYELWGSSNMAGAVLQAQVNTCQLLFLILMFMITVHWNSMAIIKLMLIPVFSVQSSNSI
jgi:hypothetical protein